MHFLRCFTWIRLSEEMIMFKPEQTYFSWNVVLLWNNLFPKQIGTSMKCLPKFGFAFSPTLSKENSGILVWTLISVRKMQTPFYYGKGICILWHFSFFSLQKHILVQPINEFEVLYKTYFYLWRFTIWLSLSIWYIC